MSVEEKSSSRFFPSIGVIGALGALVIVLSVVYGLFIFMGAREKDTADIAEPEAPFREIVYTPTEALNEEQRRALEAPRKRWGAIGEVRKVSIAEAKLFLVDGSDRYEVAISPSTLIEKNGTTITLRDINIGDAVDVTASSSFTGSAIAAKSVRVTARYAIPSVATDPYAVLE